MAQFDSLIILPLIFSLFFVLVIYYSIFIVTTISRFFEVKKFREKKVQSQFFYQSLSTSRCVNCIDPHKSIF